jgi:hypothetical protein
VASAAVLTLSAAGSADAAMVGPTTHDYGSQTVATTGAPTTFTLQTSMGTCTTWDPGTLSCITWLTPATNTTALGGGPGGTVTSGDFAIHNLSCPYPSNSPAIPPSIGGSPPAFCQFEVSFAPITGGARSLTLNFADEGGATATLSLTGTGIAPATALPAPAPITTTTTTTKRKKCKKKHRAAAAAKKKCKKRKR